MTSKLTEEHLVAGWTINNQTMAPTYWGSPLARPGSQDSSHLILIPPKAMAFHSVIIAQSGSGKSFFLGRLIEELALKTRGRLVVLDPNADYRRLGDIVDGSWWEGAG